MPSWMLRDQALAVSGLLNAKFGGPSVRPYQPDGIWFAVGFFIYDAATSARMSGLRASAMFISESCFLILEAATRAGA